MIFFDTHVYHIYNSFGHLQGIVVYNVMRRYFYEREAIMTRWESIESIIKTAMELLFKRFWPYILSFISALAVVFLSVKNKFTEHPNVLLVLLTIMTATTVLFVILWIRIYWRNERFTFAYGVSWDKKNIMRCTNCKKPLKKSSTSPYIFYCPDKTKCKDAKYVLRDDEGNEITEKEAKDRLEKSRK